MALVAELRGFSVLEGATDSELRALADAATERRVEPGEEVVSEGDPAEDLYLVVEGHFGVLKRSAASRRSYPIRELGPGDVIGELGVLDRQPRSATVVARDAGRVLSLPMGPAMAEGVAVSHGAIAPELQRAYRKLALSLAVHVSERFRVVAENAAGAVQERQAVGSFLVNTFTLLGLYLLLVGALPELEPKLPFDRALLSFPVQLIFVVGSLQFIRQSGYALSRFGIGVRHMVGSLVEATLFTVPFLAVVTALKAGVLVAQGTWGKLPLIEHVDVLARLQNPHVQTWLAIYSVSCLVQEIIVRGALQGGMELFLEPRAASASTEALPVPSQRPPGSRRIILVTALLFAVTHLHLGVVFALAAFVPGAFWSWLFRRRRNLVGVTLSHIAVGAYVFFILGVRVA